MVKMRAKILTPSNLAWKKAIKNLVEEGILKVEQANQMCERLEINNQIK